MTRRRPPADGLAAIAKARGAKVLGIAGVDPPAPKRPSKYRNQSTYYNGVRYDSKREAGRAAELDAMLRGGAIRGWTRQVPFSLGCPEYRVRVDFLIFRLDGTADVDEIKGVETAKFRKDKQMWRRYGPCLMRVVYRDRVEFVEPDWSKA